MKQRLLFASLLLAVFVAGCRKAPSEGELSNNQITYTSRDEQADFSKYTTFFISDTIRLISDNTSDSIMVGGDAAPLVNAMKTNLTNRGYKFVNRNENPDMGINMLVTRATNIDVYSYYPGWWYGYYPYYWGGYYPYYYPYSTVYVYETGSVIADLVDLKNAETNQTLRILWTMLASKAVGDSKTNNIQGGVDGINQGFKQSPYIQK